MALGSGGAHRTEIAIGSEVVLEVATDQFDHDRVIQIAVLFIGCGGAVETRERIQKTLAVFRAQQPIGIDGHFEHAGQTGEVISHEARQLSLAGGIQHRTCIGNDLAC